MTANPVIVTRPAQDAGRLIETLQAHSIEAIAAPLVSIDYRPGVAIPEFYYQAVLLTSANGCRALGRLSTAGRFRAVLTITVGETSARAARDIGQALVIAAGGDVAALIATTLEQCVPDAGPLLYLSGAQTTGNLQGQLSDEGYDIHRVIAYQAVAAENLLRSSFGH